MDKNKILEIVSDPKNKSNNDLFESKKLLIDEFDKSKQLIIELTYHIEALEEYYHIINNEINKRKKI